MTYKEVAQMVKSIGYPYAYYEFTKDTAKKPPFVCFFYTDTDDVMADNINYQRIVTLNIELYTRDKDFDAEARVEAVLADNDMSYYKEENYIDSEQIYQIAYEMEVLING